MRTTVESYRRGGASVEIIFDTGGPFGSNYVVVVDGDDYTVNRWFYFDEYSERYAKNFANKIIRDDEYRQASLDGTADWVKIDRIYSVAEGRICGKFAGRGLFAYTAGDKSEKRKFDMAKASCEDLCKEVFSEVKQRVRNDEDLDSLNQFIEERVSRAADRAKEISSS